MPHVWRLQSCRSLGRRRWACALALIFLSSATSCLAWGAAGHRYSNNLAIDCLPSTLRPLYESNRSWIVNHASAPDLWRRDNFATEAPRHYVDLDAGGAEGAKSYPTDYWTAVGLMGRKTVDGNGTLPWCIAEYFGKLVRAFRQRDAKEIVEVSTWLGHYVADAHVPFHATVNYDGQATGQKGIHSRFEIALVEQFIKPSDLKPRAAALATVDNVPRSAFAWLRDSLAMCPGLLAADKRAVLQDADYGYNYFVEFASTARPVAVERLEASAHDTASLWAAAWVLAGRPPMVPPDDVHAGAAPDSRERTPKPGNAARSSVSTAR
jgi:hypothetical protein